jgi:tRNA/tmRNA/rRNA uracil-C5-methylase (TrmA/RlmC/RlmD family)
MTLLGKPLELEIEKIAHGGVCVARHEGRVVFVSGAIPGEKVLAEVFEDTGKSFVRARVQEVVKPSPYRAEHFWRAARQGAGGAEFGHIQLQHQRTLKAQVLKESLERMAKIDVDVSVESVPGDDERDGLHYRTRVQLNVDAEGIAGPVRERTNEVIFSKKLPLAVLEIEELEVHLKSWPAAKKIFLAASSTGQTQYLVDKNVHGAQTLIERVNDRTFRLSPGAFWQVHNSAAGLLSSEVISQLDALDFDNTRQNLDLYSGAGLFSATIAQKIPGAKFTAVESHRGAVEDGKKSSDDLPGLKFVRSDVLEFVRREVKRSTEYDTVVLDPPRSGAAGKVIEQVVALRPRNIIYVACDPVALARDLALLLAAGFELKSLRAFDIFPHTHHFECVATLTRVT